MICPADKVGRPAKVIWPAAFFFKSKHLFHTTFVLAIGQPTSYDGQLRQLTFKDYIIQLAIDLK